MELKGMFGNNSLLAFGNNSSIQIRVLRHFAPWDIFGLEGIRIFPSVGHFGLEVIRTF